MFAVVLVHPCGEVTHAGAEDDADAAVADTPLLVEDPEDAGLGPHAMALRGIGNVDAAPVSAPAPGPVPSAAGVDGTAAAGTLSPLALAPSLPAPPYVPPVSAAHAPTPATLAPTPDSQLAHSLPSSLGPPAVPAGARLSLPADTGATPAGRTLSGSRRRMTPLVVRTVFPATHAARWRPSLSLSTGSGTPVDRPGPAELAAAYAETEHAAVDDAMNPDRGRHENID